jgi:integrase
MSNFLTRDNPYLSRVTNEPVSPNPASAVDCTRCLPEQVASYVADSLAANTRRAYLSDLAHFESWGGCIPASDTMVAFYLAAHAETLGVATLVRRLSSISKAHAARGLTNPVRAEMVKATLRGIRRCRGTAHREARPLLKEDLFAVLDAMGDTMKDVRDRALLLIGFAGGFRRSELVAIDVGAIEFVRRGAIVTIPRSKTDQVGTGRKVGIPVGRTRHCPVGALEDWITRAGLIEGPVFRPVDRHGRIHPNALTGEAVWLIIKERAAAAGINPAGFSGHSLRAGLATSAAQAGVPTWRIRAQTGHASDATLSRYVRDGELFTGNAAGVIL